MRPDLLGLQPDLYQRYSFLRRVIDEVFLAGEPGLLRILDVGSGAARLTQAFVGAAASVVRADVAVFGEPDIVLLDPDGPLPFADRAFDVVVGLEVLEHVPHARRPALLAECQRVARVGVVMCCPVADDGAAAAEAVFGAVLQRIAGKQHDFLAEHQALGLPRIAEVADALAGAGWTVESIANAPVDQWLVFNLVNLIYAYDHGGAGQISAFNTAINQSTQPLLRHSRHYRAFFIAARSAEVQQRAHDFVGRVYAGAPEAADSAAFARFALYLPEFREDLQTAVRIPIEAVIAGLRSDILAKDASLAELRGQAEGVAKAFAAQVEHLLEQSTHSADALTANIAQAKAELHQALAKLQQAGETIKAAEARHAGRAKGQAVKIGELERALQHALEARAVEAAQAARLAIEFSAFSAWVRKNPLFPLIWFTNRLWSGQWRGLVRAFGARLYRSLAPGAGRLVATYRRSRRARLIAVTLRTSKAGDAAWRVMRRSILVRRAVETLRRASRLGGPVTGGLTLVQPHSVSDGCEPVGYTPPIGLLPWFNPLRIAVVAELAERPHLNVLLPGLAMKHMSGGPNTALSLAARLAGLGVRVRLISADAPLDPEHSAFWAHVGTLAGEHGRPNNLSLVDASNRSVALQIGANDVFMATAWWTAQMAKYAVRHTRHAKFVYLIQDYEPLLHASSTQYALSAETYQLDSIPVVNSSLLAEFLVANRIGRFAEPDYAANAIVFEPAVDTTRFHPPPVLPTPAAKRRLLFYARPAGGLRNLYELGVAALQKLMADPAFDPHAWEFVGMGEAFAPVALGRGTMLTPAPWLDFDGYAAQMRDSDVLLSLMLSPHPSYPPLEMAACGKPVVTTAYANKTAGRLQHLSPHIIAVEPTIESIADGLLIATQRAESGPVAASALRLPSTWEESFREALPRLHRALVGLFDPLAPASFPGYADWPRTAYDVLRFGERADRRKLYADAEPGLISFMTPVWNTDPAFVAALAETVLNQDCGPGFEWILLDNAPTRPDTVALLDELAKRPGIRLVRTPENLGIVGGLRRCLEEARHRYVVPLDADDLLTPDCVRVLTTALRAANYPVLAYTDEDTADGADYREPYCKPDWDPVLFVHSCYIAHLCAIDREAALSLGCYTDRRPEGSSDWDTFMRFSLAGHVPHHVPETLYTWRIHAGSTAGNIHAKDYIFSSQRHVVESFVAASAQPDAYRVELSPLFRNTPDWRIVRAQDADWPVTTVLLGGSDQDAAAHRRADIAGHRAVGLPDAADLAGLLAIAEAQPGRLVHLLAAGAVILDPSWPAEAVTLFELFPGTVVVGGTVHRAGKVLDADGYFGFGDGWGSPNSGRDVADVGYACHMWKPHSANTVPVQHCVVRAEFLRDTLRRLTGTVAGTDGLAKWLGAAAAGQSLRVVYSPFLVARFDQDLPVIAAPERWAFERCYGHLIPDTARLSPRLGLTWQTAYRPISRSARAAQQAARRPAVLRGYPEQCAAELLARRVMAKPVTEPCRFALLTLLYERSPVAAFRETVRSVMAQTHGCAEWIILENGPVPSEIAAVLDQLAGNGKIHRLRSQPLGIIGGLRYCLERATADYVVPLDGDDLLAVDALEQLAIALHKEDRPTFVFSDEDVLGDAGLDHPLRRGAFDPVLNLADSYVWHVCAFQRDRALALGAYTDPQAEYCHDWDTVTRFAANGEAIVHVPHVLYHWRAHAQSSSNSGTVNPGSRASVQHMLECTIARQSAPELYQVRPFPIHRGAEQDAILRRAAAPVPITLIRLGVAHATRLPDAFAAVLSQTVDFAHLSAVTTEFAVVLGAGCLPDREGGCWEAMRLWEMHRDVAVIGGRILDGDGIVIQSAEPSGGGWSPVGLHRTHAGPFAMALKPQTAQSVPRGFFYCRTEVLREAMTQMGPDDNADRLADHVGATAQAHGLRIAYSPLIEATRAE